MYWILAALVVLATLLVPRFRPAGLVGCAILAALLGWGVVERWMHRDPPAVAPQPRGAPVSPAAVRLAFPPASVELSELQLTGSGAPFDLRGTVRNASPDLVLRAMTVQILRRDCHAKALEPSGCATVWQDRHWINVTVPPGETRQFAISIWAHSAPPRARGTVKDEFSVFSAAGEPARK